ncbi:hypothetical protein [Rhizorhabdus wittichii]|jgi:multidrug transporter EmrE-like cation transporter|uniref:Small multidrug resistance protein n=1 Tax=Rhizorhabdus wittichii TaxID=160791 RepID=A0A975D7Q9_9SPHN|nr:hypothetical protein [Rhizorhabdus wittichii]ARR55966.1 hypothetical protein HY78_22190 [Rhizorhabdus wittichii DC-6]QTH23260.1 hypothetical protein HRJ34_07100 [Rhizorhabdus wittichii]
MNITIILFMILSIAFQVVGIALVPTTSGFTNPIPTLLSLASFCLGVFFMARISQAGVNLSFFIPLLAAGIPMASIAVGILLYGEPASLAKIGTLLTACTLIGVANIL